MKVLNFERVDLEIEILGETGKVLIPFVVSKWEGQISQVVLDKGSKLIWQDLDTYESEFQSTRAITAALRKYLDINS